MAIHARQAPLSHAAEARHGRPSAPVALCITHQRNGCERIAYASDALLRMTGHDREALLGRPVRWLTRADPQAAGEWEAAILPACDGPAIRLTLRPVFDTDGQVLCLLADRPASEAAAASLPADPPAPSPAARDATALHDALLHEVNHRIRNTLQTVAALVQLQRRHADDASQRAALAATGARIDAVATACRGLYGSLDAPGFELADLLRALFDELAPDGARLQLDVEPQRLPARCAVPLALLCREAVASLLADAAGRLHVRVWSAGGRTYVRLDAGGSAVIGDDPFGHSLIDAMAGQLQATLTRDREGALVIGLPAADVRADP